VYLEALYPALSRVGYIYYNRLALRFAMGFKPAGDSWNIEVVGGYRDDKIFKFFEGGSKHRTVSHQKNGSHCYARTLIAVDKWMVSNDISEVDGDF
jgi:hypothetical protein